MRRRSSYFGLAFAVGFIACGAHSYASDLEQCELTSASEQQRYEACDRIQREPSSSPRDRARALLQLGYLVQMKPDGFHQAIAAWDKAIAADTTYAPAVVARAEWMILENKGHDAVRFLQPVLAANPDDIEALVMMGRAHASLQLPELALQTFGEALKRNPNHVRALYEIGQVYELAGDFANAAIAYERAGENFKPTFRGIGIEHPYIAAARDFDRIGEVGKAVALVTRVIDLSPDGGMSPVYEARASYYQALGRDEEAISDLTTALRQVLPGQHIPLLFKRAILYQRTGKSQQAEDDLRRALNGGDRRIVLRMQVYLRNQGFQEIKIDGVIDPGLMKVISACLATAQCSEGLGNPI
jgi:tetratricopeptide (TPR) repeat protein